jgi:uncharacterized protein
MIQAAEPRSREAGRLAENVAHFARALRRAGLPVGPGATIEALQALEIAGLNEREDVRAALRAVLVKRREHSALFDQVFAIFWRRRGFLEKWMSLALPTIAPPEAAEPAPPGALRVNEALFELAEKSAEATVVERDARLTASQEESFHRKDFAQMSAQEIARARELIARLRLASEQILTRRWTPAPRGRALDARASLRRTLRAGGHSIELARRARRLRAPPIVALCDISGSMSEYVRPILHFLHALTERRPGVQSFLFGTRLTNVTRALRARDIDEALAGVAREARDWSGGTRIAASLHKFNQDWSRRTLGQGAVVLLFTDGLERDPGPGLDHEMRRLHASCRRLIWLNPLLRFDKFEAKAQGIRAILPHVDAFLPIHNLASMEDLCHALNEAGPRKLERRAAKA